MNILEGKELEQADAYDPSAARLQQIENLKAEGYNIILPAANELQVDIDSEDSYIKFTQAMDILTRYFEDIKTTEKVSKSGMPHRHIVVTLPFEVSEAERIAFQAALGSDHKREILGAIRNQLGIQPCTLFAEKP